MSHKSGYAGHDSMREKAVKAFGSQMRDSSCHKSGGRVLRNMGGPMSIPANTADSIQQANQLLANRAGIKRGGAVVRRAIGGVGKVRHGQSSRTGAQLAPRNRHNGKG